MKTIALIILLFISQLVKADELENVYSALQQNDRAKARELLEKVIKNPETKVEASMLLMLLNTAESKYENLPLMQEIYEDLSSPSEYIFPLWFDDALMGGYGKKEQNRLEFLKKLLKDSNLNGSINAGLRYIIGFHYLMSNNIDDALKVWEPVGSIKNWQFVGPFDNTSGSGFNKNYGPIGNPENSAEFLSNTNSKIKWFTPKYPQRDPWMSNIYHVPGKEAIVYTQSFVYSDEEKEVIFAIGGTGTFKFWVNDKLVMQELVEQRTELDVYKCKYKLNKGFNRVLIQLGYTYNFSFPNFIFRIINDNGNVIDDYVSSAEIKPYKKDLSNDKPKDIRHFAEVFFEKKIKEEPSNMLNYILLSKVYYRRSLFNKAIEILEQGKEQCNNNILFEFELLLNYLQIDNRTELMKQLEHLRKIDPELIFLKIYDFKVLLNQEDYNEVEIKLKEIKNYFGENSKLYIKHKLEFDVAKKDYQSLVKVINRGFELYPENSDIVKLKYSILKNVDKDPAKALKLIQKYLTTNYDYPVIGMLVDEYKNQGKTSEIEELLTKNLKKLPEAFEYAEKLATFHYINENFNEALKWNKYCLDNAPYNASFWKDRAYLNDAAGNKSDAIKDLLKSIHLNPNLFDAREKLRELEGKESIISYFKNDKLYQIIDDELKKDLTDDVNFKYIFDDKNIMLFKEGSSISQTSYALRLLNQKGIDRWKTISIGFNSYTQRLIIEEAKVIKSDGKKIAAERNYNRIVFPSLEVGDIILVKYRFENYVWGKLSKEFWTKHAFSNFVPVKNSSLTIYAPKDFNFEIAADNTVKQPVKEISDDYVSYKWSFEKVDKIEYEAMMPSIYNSGMTVNISSVKSWKTIATWYKDLVLSNTIDDYILEKTFKEIFKENKNLPDLEKAKKIYNYILDNIKYSHLSFRQSNYVPQKPMITISTKLGDCKDLSLLYHSLAKKAGLRTNLVLVNTRDNREDIVLPSIDFNHCIIKINIDGNDIFQELTNEYLPFGATPNNLFNSQALVIPNNNKEKVGSQLIKITKNKNQSNSKHRTTQVKIKNDEVSLNTTLTLTGSLASRYRNNYLGITKNETREKVIDYFDNYFEKDLKLIDFDIKNLADRANPIVFSAKLKIDSEVKSIGGLKMLKLQLFDEIVSLNDLPEKERAYPILYWLYENCDLYDNEIIVEIPENSVIVEKPAAFKINEKFIDYELSITSISDTKLKISRKAKIKETTLPSSYYQKLRETLRQILKAEDIYLVYKEKK